MKGYGATFETKGRKVLFLFAAPSIRDAGKEAKQFFQSVGLFVEDCSITVRKVQNVEEALSPRT